MKKIFNFIIITLLISIILIQYPIHAQKTNFSSVCSLAGNIKIDYPANSWIVEKDYKNTEELVLEHNSGKALFKISSGYYSGWGQYVLPTPAQAASNIVQKYSTEQDFQLYSKIGNTHTGDYYIELPKFVPINPTYLLAFKYTDTDMRPLNVISLLLTIGSNFYMLSFVSEPEITAELWPTIEQMLPSFYGSAGVSDRVFDKDANGYPFFC